MDNLTHSLVGLAAAKAGLGRRSPYATFVCVAAANLPDIDIVALAGGPAFYLQHHRGITHSVVGMLALAVVFPLLFVASERLWARLRGRAGRASPKWLLVCSLLLSVSHPLLDWTNSYGVRPLLPWDGSWFYGDLLFIVDPWVWLLLGGACSLLATARWRVAAWGLLALAVTVIFVRVGTRPDLGMPVGALVLWGAGLAALVLLHLKKAGERFGRRAPALALALVAAYCGVLSVFQARAKGEAEVLADGLAGREGQRLVRVAATPVLADPLTWRCLAEADRSTFRFDMKLGTTPLEDLRNRVGYAKPSGAEAEMVARASEGYAARVFLDFARFPVARVVPGEAGGRVVQFADLRYTEPGSRARVGGFALDVPVGPAPPAR
ncbi:MAG TPA: metal-dependent hydrolase [Pyrinomonadaceae bacterium]